MAKKQYSLGIGFGKSFKNVVIVMGVPALLLLVDNWMNWIPNEWHVIATPIMGFIAYLVKNYISNN